MEFPKKYKIIEEFSEKPSPNFSEWYKLKIVDIAYLLLRKIYQEENKRLTGENILIYPKEDGK
jgi:hypothetical protein